MIPATPAPAWRVLVTPGIDRGSEEYGRLEAAVLEARRRGRARRRPGGPSHAVARTGHGRPPARRKSSLRLKRRLGGVGAPGLPMDGRRLRRFSRATSIPSRRTCGATSSGKGRAVADAGIATRMIRAEEASARPELLVAMADLYEAHNEKFGPWAAKFLERDFFLRLPEFHERGLGSRRGPSTEAARLSRTTNRRADRPGIPPRGQGPALRPFLGRAPRASRPPLRALLLPADRIRAIEGHRFLRSRHGQPAQGRGAASAR